MIDTGLFLLINDSLSNVGSYISTSVTTTSVPRNASGQTEVDSINIANGKYLIIATARFAEGNTTGIRTISITYNSGPLDSTWFVSVAPAPSGSTSMQMVRYIDTNGSMTVHLMARHNDTVGNLDVETRMFAIKIN